MGTVTGCVITLVCLTVHSATPSPDIAPSAQAVNIVSLV